MDSTKLGTPRPKAVPSQYSPREWPALRAKPLSRVDKLPEVDTAQLLMSRKSCRKFGTAPDESSLGHLLYLSAYALSAQPSSYGFGLRHSCAPSAGAIHGVHVLAVTAVAGYAHRYDALSHAMVELTGSETYARLARDEAAELVELRDATLLLLAAEPGMYAAKYSAHETLMWRDAGVLLGYFSVVAQALDLDFCILGVTGDEALRHLDGQTQLLGVGVAAVGVRR